jgi:hypothetical protein
MEVKRLISIKTITVGGGGKDLGQNLYYIVNIGLHIQDNVIVPGDWV